MFLRNGGGMSAIMLAEDHGDLPLVQTSLVFVKFDARCSQVYTKWLKRL